MQNLLNKKYFLIFISTVFMHLTVCGQEISFTVLSIEGVAFTLNEQTNEKSVLEKGDLLLNNSSIYFETSGLIEIRTDKGEIIFSDLTEIPPDTIYSRYLLLEENKSPGFFESFLMFLRKAFESNDNESIDDNNDNIAGVRGFGDEFLILKSPVNTYIDQNELLFTWSSEVPDSVVQFFLINEKDSILLELETRDSILVIDQFNFQLNKTYYWKICLNENNCSTMAWIEKKESPDEIVKNKEIIEVLDSTAKHSFLAYTYQKFGFYYQADWHLKKAILAEPNNKLTKALQNEFHNRESFRINENNKSIQFIKEIEESLNKVIGVKKFTSKPSIHLSSNKSRGAFYFPKSKAIYIEEEVLDICQSFGLQHKDALATILAHELIHHYFGHGNSGNYLLEYQPENSEKATSRLEEEGFADEKGLVYSYFAGYKSFEIAPELLTKLYDEYNWSNSKNYLSFPERQQMISNALDSINKWIPVFEMANILYSKKYYLEAAACYEKINEKYPSRELLYNAAICYTLEALQDKDLIENHKYIYPLEIDIDSRLNPKTIFGFGNTNTLLVKAKKILQDVLKMDEHYALAFLALGTVEQLLNNPDTANYHCEKAIYLATESNDIHNISNAIVLKAVLLGNENDSIRHYLNQAKTLEEENYFASINLEILDGKRLKEITGNIIKRPLGQSAQEKINDYAITEIVGQSFDSKVSFKTIQESPFEIISYKPENTLEKEYLIEFRSEKASFGIYSTPFDYSGKSQKGVEIGDNLDIVKSKYETPSIIVPARQGKYLLYEKERIIFFISYDNRVEKWILFTN